MDKKAFITEILPKAAKHVANEFFQESDYTDIKGYLAEAEVWIHKFITESINKNFPNSLIYSEEGDDVLPSKQEEDFSIWIMDPICGTANFVKNIPFYAISLCVLDKSGVLCAGIYDMNRDELFLADRKETTLNGKKVSASQTDKLKEAFVSVNCNQSAYMDDGLKIDAIVNKFMPPVSRRVKIFESANLEMAYVACGRLDAYVNFEDKVWDIAAGSLMIASAGGKTRTIQGSISELSCCKGVVASNKFLMEPLLKILKI